jgi:hypothetical protein
MAEGLHLPALPEGFGRAAEKLADTVRHVVDIAVGPDRIRARAQAQADSELISARARAEVQEIEARAIERLRKREARRQQNVESITLQALPALPSPDQISNQPVSEDWTSRFFEECQDISDAQMQQIWARIMAGEVARPGSFSPKTLSIVRDLTKTDANLFARLCQFIWDIPTVGRIPIIPNNTAPAIVDAGLYFSALMHLTSIGLIEFSSAPPYKMDTAEKELTPSYYGNVYTLFSKNGGQRDLPVGQVILTAFGNELATIATVEPNESCKQLALEFWAAEGWETR